MATMTVTVRLNDSEKAALDAAAAREGVRPATLAASLIRRGMGVPLERSPVVEGPLVSSVRTEFGERAGAIRETAVALAQQVEAGSASAAPRLLALMRAAEPTTQEEIEDRAWGIALGIPDRGLCARCSRAMGHRVLCTRCRSHLPEPTGLPGDEAVP